MQCFIGNCTSFQECRHLGLVSDCPTDQEYDACLTDIVQKAHGRLTIVKRCGMSPCSISEMDWWGDECDRKSDEDSYSCTSCCTETLCNNAKNIRQSHVEVRGYLVSLTTIVLLSHTLYKTLPLPI